jgi:hypothetical protein
VAVAVVVGRGGAHAEAAAGHAGPPGHVGEGAVPVVAVEGVAERARRREEVRRAAVDEVDVEPAVAVVVEDGDAGPDRLRQETLRRVRVVVHPSDAARLRRHLGERDARAGLPSAGDVRRREKRDG